MIILLPNSFQLGQNILALFPQGLPANGNALFTVDRDELAGREDAQQSRILNAEGNFACNFLERWRNVISPRTQRNQLLLFWEKCDDTLFATIEFLHKQQQGYYFDICLILAKIENRDTLEKLLEYKKGNPLDKVVVGLDGTRKSPDFLSSVWYVGNEDDDKNPILDFQRVELVQSLLETILYTGASDDLIQQLRFYPRDLHETQFVTFGIKSWIPSSDNASNIVQRASILVEERAHLVQAPFNQDPALTADSYFSDLYKAIQNDKRGEKTISFEDELPTKEDTPFDNWSCPFFRNSAKESGQDIIDSNRHEINEYHTRLKSIITELAPQIRENGQAELSKTKKRSHEFILEGNDEALISKISALLTAFFPEAKKHVAYLKGCAPCQALSSPSDRERTLAFVYDPRQKFDKLCEGLLPSNKTWLKCASLTILLYIVSYVSFRFQWDWRITLGLVAIPTLFFAGFLWYVHAKGKIITDTMIDYFQRKNEWLFSCYKEKVKWLVNNTLHLAIRQLASDLISTGRRLQRNFDALFNELMPVNANDNERELQHLCDEMNLTHNDIETLQNSIFNEVKTLLVDSLNNPDQICGAARIRATKSRWIANLISRSRAVPLQPTPIVKCELDICVLRNKPTLMSRLDEVERQDSLYYKVFVLGLAMEYENWGRDWMMEARTKTMHLYTLQSNIPAPVLIRFRPRLSLSEMEKTLTITEVK